MELDHFSVNSLIEMHDSIRKCLEADDATPDGQMKRYGVREYPDWREQLKEIERLFDERQITYDHIDLTLPAKQSPIPSAAILYERIKQCLSYEDNLSLDIQKPYGVREQSDWKEQADSLEKALDSINYNYKKISW